MVSREVNVDRPEHSWIPFYRELAEKLVNEGWRERQGELVGVLGEMASSGLRMPPLASKLNESIDPITFLAMFNRSLNWNHNRQIIDWLRGRFDISAVSPLVDPWVPKSNRYVISTARNSEPVWDMLETIIDQDYLVGDEESSGLMRQFDLCLRNIGISKLTAGMFWVKSDVFLHIDTVNAVGGKYIGFEARDAKSYFACLARTKELTRQSLPEVNMSVFKTQNPDWDPPKVWIVRGGRGAVAVEEFRTGGYTGVGFAFGDFDISKFGTVDELSRFCDERSLSHDGIDQVVQFLTDIEISDYVLMPGRGSAVNYYGRVTSDPYHDREGTHLNRRDVEWSPNKILRSQLDLSSYRSTVTRPNRDVQDKYLKIIGDDKNEDIGFFDFAMPEDSWVPFHLEVGRKLIEGEWWRKDKRDVFARMVHDIRWADPGEGSEDSVYEEWPGDPYSFYLSSNMRMVETMREPAHRRVKELLEIKESIPSSDYHTISLGVNWGWETPLDDHEVKFLWDLFRLVWEFDPANCDPEDEVRFIEFYDRAASASFLRGRRAGWLSIWLYWIDATKYVATRRLSRSALNLEDELGVSSGLPTGRDYLDALRGLRELGASKGFSILDVNRLSSTRADLGLDDGGFAKRYTVDDMIKDGVFFERTELERILGRFKDKKNLILQGPPGVGKTFVTRRFAYALIGEQAFDRVRNVQFHQSYSYEDFVEGFRPETNADKQLIFERQLGTFLKMCEDARMNSNLDYVIVVDEINRGNLSRVFGELLSLIEKDKRGEEFEVTLASGRRFSVPENVYILGTMNLADRSLAGIDYAMRRRFGFVTLEPQFEESRFEDWLRGRGVPDAIIERINSRMSALNEVIAGDASLGRNFAVGHSYFCNIADGGEDDWERWYREIVKTEIQPLLEEYWFDDLGKADGEVEKLVDGVPGRPNPRGLSADDVGERVCTRCGVSKPLTEEHWNRNVLARGSGYCKPCDSERVGQWRRERGNQESTP